MGTINLESIDRPLDFLNQCRQIGREIIVKLKDGKEFSGTLIAFDIHINLVLNTTKGIGFIRGENVVFIS